MKRIIATVFLSIFFLGFTSPIFAATKGTINIATYLSQFVDAVDTIGDGGGVNVMLCPGDVQYMNKELEKIKGRNIRLMVRGHFPKQELTEKLADEWVDALDMLDTPNKIYFFPVNEPNTPQEGYGGSAAPDSTIQNVRDYTLYLKQALAGRGLLNTKVYLIAPTIDPFQIADHGTRWLERLGGSAYFSQFAGISISLYGQYDANGNGSSLVSGPPEKRGDFYNSSAFTNFMNSHNMPVFVESGVLANAPPKPRVVYGYMSIPGFQYGDHAVVDFFKFKLGESVSEGGWGAGSNLAMLSILSFNPDVQPNTEVGWIFGSQTAGVLRSITQDIGPRTLSNVESTSRAAIPFDGSKFTQSNCVILEKERKIVAGDNAVSRVPFPKDISERLGIVNITGLVGTLRDIGIDFVGELFPANNNVDDYYKEPSGDIPRQAQQAQLASKTLEPHAIKASVTPFLQPQYAQITSRVCVNDPDDPEERVIDSVSKVTTRSKDDGTVRNAVEGGERLSSFYTKYQKKDQNFDRATLVLDPLTAKSCDEQTAALPLAGKEQPSTKRNLFTGGSNGGVGGAVAEVPVRLLSSMLSVVDRIFGELHITVPAHASLTTLDPYAGEATCFTAGCDKQELNDIAYLSDEEKTALSDNTGGFTNTIRSHALTYEKGNGEDTQTWKHTAAGSAQGPSQLLMRKTRENASGLMNCALFPKALQKSMFEAGKCGGNEEDPEDTIAVVSGGIDITNNSCRLAAGNVNQVAAAIQPYFDDQHIWGTVGAENFRRFAMELQSLVPSSKNPALFLAIWIEESAASGSYDADGGTLGLGCMPEHFPEYSSTESRATLDPRLRAYLGRQVPCLSGTMDLTIQDIGGDTSDIARTYRRFMCRFAGLGGRSSGYDCDGEGLGGLYNRIGHWYELIAGSCGVVN